jgi:hypothetical protein
MDLEEIKFQDSNLKYAYIKIKILIANRSAFQLKLDKYFATAFEIGCLV